MSNNSPHVLNSSIHSNSSKKLYTEPCILTYYKPKLEKATTQTIKNTLTFTTNEQITQTNITRIPTDIFVGDRRAFVRSREHYAFNSHDLNNERATTYH